MSACSFSHENYFICSAVSGFAGTVLTAASITTALLPAVYTVTTVALPIILSVAALAAWILFAISLIKGCQNQQVMSRSHSFKEGSHSALTSSQKEIQSTDEKHNEVEPFLNSLRGRDPTEKDRIKFVNYINKIGINQTFDDYNTLLMYLAKLGHPIPFIKILAEHGADFNFQEPHRHDNLFADNTPLIWAIANAHNEMAMEIAHYPQNLDIRGHFGNTALILAVAKGYDQVTLRGDKLTVSNLQLVTTLLQKGANPNIKNEEGYSPLHLAVIRRHEAMVKVLLEKGARIDFNWQKALNYSYDQAYSIQHKNSRACLLDKDNFEASKDTVARLLQDPRYTHTH